MSSGGDTWRRRGGAGRDPFAPWLGEPLGSIVNQNRPSRAVTFRALWQPIAKRRTSSGDRLVFNAHAGSTSARPAAPREGSPVITTRCVRTGFFADAHGILMNDDVGVRVARSDAAFRLDGDLVRLGQRQLVVEREM